MTTSITRTTSASLSGSYAGSDVSKLGEALRRAAATCHLLAPSQTCGALPEGTSVSIGAVLIDPVSEVYPVDGGRFGIARAGLDRLAQAAGVDWDPVLSGRVDDGADPNLVRWRSVGRVRRFDGSTLTIMGEKEVDLRPDSPTVLGLEARAKAKGKSAEGQIREQRMHAQSLAETKSRLRAVRSLGLRSSYTREELERPFVVASLQLTGQCSDAATTRAITLMRAAAFFGTATPQRAALSAPLSVPALPAPSTHFFDVEAEAEPEEVPAVRASSYSPVAREREPGEEG